MNIIEIFQKYAPTVQIENGSSPLQTLPLANCMLSAYQSPALGPGWKPRSPVRPMHTAGFSVHRAMQEKDGGPSGIYMN